MGPTERTSLLRKINDAEHKVYFSPAHRVLFAGFLISIALSFTQVP
jgi:hypothetical protein